MLVAALLILFSIFAGSALPAGRQVFAQVQNPTPLRPYPNQFTEEEASKTLNPNSPDPSLTIYCAQRPTAVQNNAIDKRQPTVTLQVQGNLSADFSRFITPFLSITDTSKPDASLSDLDKSKQYLADYLEGRAYYEGVSEDPDNLSLARLGVFRKLAPLTYQDQLKHAMVARATGNFDSADNIYGFAPASTTVHDYEVTDGTTSINLSDFANHLKPLTENFEDDAEYQEALESWEASDNGRWANLWAYVPMFSREDVKAFIEPVDEPGQTTNPNPIEVAIPHLARTYEVASALSFILSPYQEDRSPVEPNLASQWINPAPWTTDPSWLDSDDSQPGNWDDLGSVCDPQQTVITSSGDLAHDERSNTQTFKTVQMDNPFYDPDCAVEYPDPLNPDIILIDDSACFVDQTVRFSPTYLKTYTPFLHAIMDQLLTGPNAVFNIFKPYSQIADEDIENWPAAGNESEENLAYTFSGGQAEAGNREDPSKAQYYFKYLGTLHCQKEKLIAGLQPFLGGVAEIDPQCTGGAPDGGPGGPPGKLPTGPRWMQWPVAGHSLNQCYRDTTSGGNHSGLDLGAIPEGGPVYPGAVGTIIDVGYSPSVFGYYVIIAHDNGWYSLYAHMQPNVKVRRGQQITNLIQVLGYEDDTGNASRGNHLHLGLARSGNVTDFYVNGPTADPCDAIEGCSCPTSGN